MPRPCEVVAKAQRIALWPILPSWATPMIATGPQVVQVLSLNQGLIPGFEKSSQAQEEKSGGIHAISTPTGTGRIETCSLPLSQPTEQGKYYISPLSGLEFARGQTQRTLVSMIGQMRTDFFPPVSMLTVRCQSKDSHVVTTIFFVRGE